MEFPSLDHALVSPIEFTRSSVFSARRPLRHSRRTSQSVSFCKAQRLTFLCVLYGFAVYSFSMVSPPHTPDLVPPELARILAETPELERAFLVGGCVRDWLLACAVKDCDIEVFGIDYERLANCLRRWGKTD